MGVASRGLGRELRALRMEKKLSMRNAADKLGWQSSKISRIENGQQGISPTDAASLLAVYGVTGHERERLLARVEKTEDLSLLEVRGGLSRESHTLIELEAEADRIFNLEPLWLPGLLQTADYTRAVMKACHVPEGDIEVRVVARMGRQTVLGKENAPEVEFAIDEGALRRPIVSSRLMSRQLRQICETAERGNVTVRVLPFSLGGHNGLDGSLEILTFARNSPIVYLDHGISGFFLEEGYQVAFYQTEMARLREIALGPEESVDFIAAIAKDLGQE
ncbi:helix-turn-helix domain-containing protein [Actinorugispora endophytica]|uniref:Helix-turn-helix protein n=1 Tax=Actinorugispora endophytica TaxID=1605990 RepID=A0A4R6V482_9ACTN|nr:helix-turn-helix transcriptional regulator [Actinorugispora endophytica]TDQ55111.1 helix-turn-helix protein [Actinorugispora endophytica]